MRAVTIFIVLYLHNVKSTFLEPLEIRCDYLRKRFWHNKGFYVTVIIFNPLLPWYKLHTPGIYILIPANEN